VSIVSRLVAHWKSQGITTLRGNTEEALIEFETRHSIRLPPDIREYFRATDGMPPRARQLGCDTEGFFFWPLREVKPVPVVCKSETIQPIDDERLDKFFVFADYFGWSWAYAIDLSGPESGDHSVIHVGTLKPKTVAHSFSEFLELYLKDAPDLYVLKADQ
jgi:hypothetical protein